MALPFPETAAERDRWILAQRPQGRTAVSVHEPYACFIEEECGPGGQIEPVATIFLTNRECPFRCTMCDLWRNTLADSVPLGAIPEQIDYALRRLRAVRAIKLYNSGSFFDARAIPPEDYAAIAARLHDFERVIVECHPAFVSDVCVQFRDLLAGRLEVAMGLETVQTEVLEKLNKRMTLDQFAGAATYLRNSEIDVRAFILVQPPFMKPEEALHWAQKTLDFSFGCGVTVATLIPTRGGNGAMEELAAAGDFVPPDLSLLEHAVAYGLRQRRARVFADLWDVKRRRECAQCFAARVQRLREMNLRQSVTGAVMCEVCAKQSGGRVERTF
ncbi:MAG TPA: hypothetical protein VMU48_21700 [Terracidiphilus sp.]|nr:hypothetical protein [Terracidiphilus sp.]